ncbi:hypothetical protein [uncultured Duncaniella sp.]|uniref:hypothetical protein n=1 Tax=uncultured Duncaniella sp. TaxID=2768039 RepID=UPI00265ACF5A|nr:hypothetical protein [uncultured Duncaniella sp.]
MADNSNFKFKTGDLKQLAKGALEYGIADIIRQYETKFNVKVNSITLGANGVTVDWIETASGIRTQEEVQAEYRKQLENMAASITEKMASYGQQGIL